MKSALLVIDYQNSIFIDPPAYQATMVLERIQILIDRARNARLSIIYVQHEQAGSSWQAGCETWQFPDRIAPRSGDFVSPKKCSSAFQDSTLQAHLAEHRVQKIFVCGYATEFCIDTNVRHAASLKLETVVISDAHTTRDRPHLAAHKIIEHHNWVWSELGSIRLCQSDSVQFGDD